MSQTEAGRGDEVRCEFSDDGPKHCHASNNEDGKGRFQNGTQVHITSIGTHSTYVYT